MRRSAAGGGGAERALRAAFAVDPVAAGVERFFRAFQRGEDGTLVRCRCERLVASVLVEHFAAGELVGAVGSVA